MEKKFALSVENPLSYLICLGIKDVENRSWTTDYRGRIYIHSCGKFNYTDIDLSSLISDDTFEEYDSKVQECLKLCRMKKFNYEAIIQKLTELNKLNEYERYINFQNGIDNYWQFIHDSYGVDIDTLFEKFEKQEDVSDEINQIKEMAKQNGQAFQSFSIIGYVDLVDIVKDSDSPFAEKNMYHWILKNPVLFENPLINVKGKLRLFDVSHILR